MPVPSSHGRHCQDSTGDGLQRAISNRFNEIKCLTRTGSAVPSPKRAWRPQFLPSRWKRRWKTTTAGLPNVRQAKRTIAGNSVGSCGVGKGGSAPPLPTNQRLAWIGLAYLAPNRHWLTSQWGNELREQWSRVRWRRSSSAIPPTRMATSSRILSTMPRTWARSSRPTGSKEVDDLIALRNGSAYEKVTVLLGDLRALALEQDTDDQFHQRIIELRDLHRSKPRLIERLVAAGLI